MFVYYLGDMPDGDVVLATRLRFTMLDAATPPAPVTGLVGSFTITRSVQQQRLPAPTGPEDPPVVIARTVNELGTSGTYEMTFQSGDTAPGMTTFRFSAPGARDVELHVYFRSREGYGGGI